MDADDDLQHDDDVDDDCDADDEDNDVVSTNKSNKTSVPREPINQFGNDFVLENDPIEINSVRQIQKHKAQVPPQHEIEPEHFVVQKVINHKGSASRPSSMQLYVK